MDLYLRGALLGKYMNGQNKKHFAGLRELFCPSHKDFLKKTGTVALFRTKQ